jgi:hypothetical protein
MNKTFIFILLFLLVLILSCDFKIPALAGSYVYSEDYHFDISNKKLIDKIINFKRAYPQYQLTANDYYEWSNDKEPIRIDYENGVYSYIIPRGYSDTLAKNSIWFHCSFYLSDIKAKVNCVINVSKKAVGTPTLLRLVSYCPDKGECKTINQKGEISREENKMIKKKFETEILDKLGVKWKHKRL